MEAGSVKPNRCQIYTRITYCTILYYTILYYAILYHTEYTVHIDRIYL